MLNHPPYNAADLREPPLSGADFVSLLKAQKVERYPEPPPFYQSLFEGSLKIEDLRLWAKNMYYYWDHGLQFSTAALYIKNNDEPTRTHQLAKLVKIEGRNIVNDLVGWTTPAYEEMWLSLCEGLGLDTGEVTSWNVFSRSYFAVSTLSLVTRWWEWSWLDGIAGLFASDTLGVELMSKTGAVLKDAYGVEDKYLEFFGHYVEDSAEDIPWEEAALAEWACTRERQLTAARAYRYRLDIDYQYVQPVHSAISTGVMPLRIPVPAQ
jgi:pyrroloquinoline quinone (PQQ) biosynthesis protein C